MYFLCHPSEYTSGTKCPTPFYFQDTALCIGGQMLNLHTAPEQQLNMATFSTLTITYQKSSVRGEVIVRGFFFALIIPAQLGPLANASCIFALTMLHPAPQNVHILIITDGAKSLVP